MKPLNLLLLGKIQMNESKRNTEKQDFIAQSLFFHCSSGFSMFPGILNINFASDVFLEEK